MNANPAMTRMPLRPWPLLFRAMEYSTVPLPDPDVPEVIVRKCGSKRPSWPPSTRSRGCVVTATDPVPVVHGTVTDVGAIE